MRPTSIPIRYVPAAAGYAQPRPEVTFSVHAVPIGGAVPVRAQSRGGWVFDLNLTGEGACAEGALEVTGGSVELVQGFSGDEVHVEFRVVHDGSSAEVVVTYNTRPD